MNWPLCYLSRLTFEKLGLVETHRLMNAKKRSNFTSSLYLSRQYQTEIRVLQVLELIFTPLFSSNLCILDLFFYSLFFIICYVICQVFLRFWFQLNVLFKQNFYGFSSWNNQKLSVWSLDNCSIIVEQISVKIMCSSGQMKHNLKNYRFQPRQKQALMEMKQELLDMKKDISKIVVVLESCRAMFQK